MCAFAAQTSPMLVRPSSVWISMLVRGVATAAWLV
jgi:hypothetical protein